MAAAAVASFTPPREIIVSFSTGKDSLAVLDLCVKRFKRVVGFYMYHVPDLSFEEDVIVWAEKRYGIEITRIPHWDISRMLRNGVLRRNLADVPVMRINETDDLMRDKFGIEYIASGETKGESIQRRGMLSALGPSTVREGVWDHKRRRYFPIADWNRATVFNYLKRNHIPIPAYYSKMRTSFGRMQAEELQSIHDQYPEDYEKILVIFPFAEAIRQRVQLYETATVRS